MKDQWRATIDEHMSVVKMHRLNPDMTQAEIGEWVGRSARFVGDVLTTYYRTGGVVIGSRINDVIPHRRAA